MISKKENTLNNKIPLLKCQRSEEEDNGRDFFYFQIHASLIRIFADATESPELRMVISLIVLETEPHFFTMQALANIVRQELSGQKPGQTPGPQSNQVASFVIAKLWALAYQNTIITKRRLDMDSYVPHMPFCGGLALANP